jgi:hypothetical protein
VGEEYCTFSRRSAPIRNAPLLLWHSTGMASRGLSSCILARVTATKSQVRSRPVSHLRHPPKSCHAHTRLKPTVPLLDTPPSFSAVGSLHTHILNCAPRFHVFHFLQSLAPGCLVCLLPCRGAGRSAIAPVSPTSDCPWGLPGVQEDWHGFLPPAPTEEGGGTCREGERWRLTKTDYQGRQRQVVGCEEKMRIKFNSYLLGNVRPATAHNTNVILRRIVCISAVRFFKGHFPHNTVTPDHDERQTSPKMSPITPAYIPW